MSRLLALRNRPSPQRWDKPPAFGTEFNLTTARSATVTVTATAPLKRTPLKACETSSAVSSPMRALFSRSLGAVQQLMGNAERMSSLRAICTDMCIQVMVLWRDVAIRAKAGADPVKPGTLESIGLDYIKRELIACSAHLASSLQSGETSELKTAIRRHEKDIRDKIYDIQRELLNQQSIGVDGTGRSHDLTMQDHQRQMESFRRSIDKSFRMQDAEFRESLAEIRRAMEIKEAAKTEVISSVTVQQYLQQMRTDVALVAHRRSILPPGQPPSEEKTDLNTLEAPGSRLPGLYLEGDGDFLDDDIHPQPEKEDLGGKQCDARRLLTLLDELSGSKEGVTRSGVKVIRVLKDVGTGLASIGLHEDAISVLSILVAQCRADQVKQDCIKTRANVATSLTALSAKLGGVGRFADGLRCSEECVQLFGDLYKGQPKRFLKSLVEASLGYERMLSEAGRKQDAATVSEFCVTLCREAPLSYALDLKPTLARALTSQSIYLAWDDKPGRAMKMVEEAVGLYRELVTERGSVFHADLAALLTYYYSLLAAAGEHKKALAVTEEAVGLYRALVKERGRIFHADLAGSLADYSIRLSDINETKMALAAIEEAQALMDDLNPHPTGKSHTIQASQIAATAWRIFILSTLSPRMES
ncbi:hypothetical protein A4X06_0g3019 [Tilletia controversa]|uniref:Uncharacterized protein n=1 Tax=Tilletia controversa TaxID=13291 RepID=A0A8X7MVI2_9BASI|nr:hypothetical protein CF328_g3020 [Tilletia controversa]KAE8249896.1 hypothetical protein A4X06_0g3019 [Tilletia controversa]